MAQGVVGIIGPAVPTSFEVSNPGLFTRPLVGVRTEPYDRVVRVLLINAQGEPVDTANQPLGGAAGALVDSLGRDNNGKLIKVPGLKIDANGKFVGNDGTTAVVVDRTTGKPQKYDQTLYDLAYSWFPTAKKEAPALLGAPVDSNNRIIPDTRLDSDGKYTSLDGNTPYPVNTATGFPEKPGTGAGNPPPVPITNLSFGLSELAKSINLALVNGAVKVWSYRLDRVTPNPQEAFADFANKQINIVCLSQNTDAPSIGLLKDHVEQSSPNDAGGGGIRPRIGVAMLPREGWMTPPPNPKPSQKLADFGIDWTSSRMVLIAHKSYNDIASAISGVIARYDPWISLTMKEVDGISQTATFTDAELVVWLDPDAEGITQAHVDPILHPDFLPGAGLVMGESFTADGTGQRLYIDIVRTIDDLAFRIKAELTNPNVIGTMRINRPGLSGLRALLASLLDSRVSAGEIDNYTIDIPILGVLQKDPAQRTAEENDQIHAVQNSRKLELSVSVEYAGAIHYLIVTLKLI